MRARLKRGWTKAYPELTAGNVYRVLAIENDSFRIISDAGEPILFNPKAFDLVDPTLPADWISKRGDEGELYARPRELSEPRHFFELWHDGDREIQRRFHGYVHQLCHAEKALIPDPPTTYLRVVWKHSDPKSPITLYSELDEERCEVRKVEIFADGRIGYAEARGSFELTALGEQPVPDLAEITSNPELEPTEITREQFEAIWDKALTAEEEAG